jgi:hypothetical protein
MKAWMMRVLTAVLLAALFYTQLPRHAAALSCVPPAPVDRTYEKYDGVIIGKVEKITGLDEVSNTVKLKVIKSYKAINTDSVTVKENSSWGSFWGPSEAGQEYLFYLKQTESQWENPLCSPTKRLADGAKDLEYLTGKEIPLTKADGTAGFSHQAWNKPVMLTGAVCLSVLAVYAILRKAGRRKRE